MSKEDFVFSNKKDIIISSIIIGITLLLCVLIISGTLLKIKGFGQMVSVTGSAIKPIKSDFGIVELIFEAKSNEITKAYSKMKNDLEIIKEFLKTKNIREDEYEIKSISKLDFSDNNGKYLYTQLTQTIKISDTDVEKISKLALAATMLTEKGVEINAQTQYIYTKLEDIKFEMLKLATENAKLRATQIASTVGKKIGMPISAESGVFQIRPRYSQEISDYGISDVSSIDKEIVTTVRVKFLFE